MSTEVRSRPIGRAASRARRGAGRGDRAGLADFLEEADRLSVSDTSVDDAIRWALELVCRQSAWPLGHVFRRGQDLDVLESTRVWHDELPDAHAPFVRATNELHVRDGDEAIPARVVTEARAIWLPDLEREGLLPRRRVALECGLRSALAFPVVGDREVQGVIELFSHCPAPEDPDLLLLAAHVGRQVGRVMDRDRTRGQLRETERLAQLGAWSWEVEKDVVEASPELFRMHGLDPPDSGPGERSPLALADWMARFGSEQAARAQAAVARVLAGGPAEDFVYEVRGGRSTRWLRARAEVVERRDGFAVRIAGYTQDITLAKRAEERRRSAQRELIYQQRVLERIARGTPLDQTLTDLCRHVERHFPGARCSVLLLDRTAGVLRHAAGPSLPAGFRAAIDGLAAGEGMGACGTAAARAETVIVADTSSDPLTRAFHDLAERYGLGSVWSQPLTKTSGEVLGTFAVYRSGRHRPSRAELRHVAAAGHLAALAIERNQAETAMHAAANLDSLTGLPNRTRFLELVNHELAEPRCPVAVMMVQLDRLEQIADGLGRLAADRIVAEVAERLRVELADGGLVARFSGDAFTLMVSGRSARAARQVGDRVLAAIERPIVLDGGEFFLTASVGIARRGTQPADAFGLVRQADAALQEARAQGRGTRQVYDQRLRGRRIARFNQETELRRAIERRELVMHYQPILDLGRRAWSGVEALVRWQHPERGLIGPDHFIPLAEETGLIVPLGNHVLEQVAAQAKRWSQTMPEISIAANASVVQLADPMIAEDLMALLRRCGVSPSTLRLEVTESALMEELDSTRNGLERLVAAGVTILIDDFGTGYSSIARLGELPITGLKVDRRFTSGLSGESSPRAVLRAIADLARAHGLDVVAEGIEDARTLADVDALGCQFAQGFHLGRPAPAEAAERLLRRPPPARLR